MKKSIIIFNPFQRFSKQRLVVFGLVMAVIGSFLAYFFNGRYDGAIDLHFGLDISLLQPFVDNIISIGSLFVVFGIIGKILYSKICFLEVLAMVLIARIPLYLLTLTNVNNLNYELGQALMLSITTPERNIPMDAVILSVGFAIVSILALVWLFALLYNGFKFAAHSKGAKLIVSFIIAVVLSEILSKGLLLLVD